MPEAPDLLLTLGERLREERLRLNLSVGEFAKTAGVSDRSQRNYESGERLPDAGYLARLKEASGADVDYILSGERAVWRNLGEEIERQCNLVERVVAILEEATQARGIALDASQKAKCARWLYRSAVHGAPVTEVVVDELLSMIGRG